MTSHSISAAVELPWPSRTLHPNARPHWGTKARATQSARWSARLAARHIGPVKADAINVTCIFSPPPPKRNRDLDGLLSSCKAYFDGIADAIGVDDSRFRHQAPAWGEPVKGGAVRIKIEIEAAP